MSRPSDDARPAAGPDGEIGTVLAALADPTRRELLETLVDAGQASATVLARSLPVSRQAVVKHLQVLVSVGLAEGNRVGREVRYSPRPAGLAASARWLADLSDRWDRRLGALKRAAEAPALFDADVVQVMPAGIDVDPELPDIGQRGDVA